MRLAIIGAGYVGLVTGASAAVAGHHVTLVERSAERRASLEGGRVPVAEPGLQEAFDRARERIEILDAIDRIEAPDLVLVAVGTPVAEDGTPDDSQLVDALAALRRHPSLDVSIRSTLSPGTSVRLPRLLDRPDGSRLSTNPEFLRQGHAMDDFARPARIVIGRFPETSLEHLAKLDALYAGVPGPRLVVDAPAAELIKNVANAFLALKLSFVNEVASLSEEYDVDVEDVLAGIGLDPRIGTTYMRPGLGFGGSCLPKELQILADAGRQRGLPMHIARAAALVNHEQQDRFARRLLNEIGGPPARIGVLGLTFKAHTDDLRGSPALSVVRRLLTAGHEVIGYDPAASDDDVATAVPGLVRAGRAEDVFQGADAVAIATDWPEFRELDLPAVRRTMRGTLLYDGRNLLDPAAATAAGFAYRRIGKADADARPSAPDANGAVAAKAVGATGAG